MRRGHVEQPTLITTAPVSKDDEYDRRKRKYAILMGIRVLCVVAAGLTYQLSVPLSLAFVGGGVVLPWCAVLIANDRPARKRKAATGFMPPPSERALPPAAGDERTVDG